MPHLLIVTQAVDREDENLGAFYCWFEELAKKYPAMTILAGRRGKTDFPSHVEIYTWEGRFFLSRLWKFWALFSRRYAAADAVFFHQIPEFVLAAAPFLLGARKKRNAALWYAHKSVTLRLRLAELLVDWVISSSQEGFRLPSKKVVFVGQAINTEIFEPSPRSDHRSNQGQAPGSELRLISIGRIAPIKDYETILRACAILKDTYGAPWTFSLIGGPIRERDVRYLNFLQDLSRNLGIHERVRFLGARPFSEIHELLRAHDLFLNASRTGSLDKAVLEAMACGLTVITANEAYRPHVPAPYFLEYVSPQFLAQRIKTLADDPRPNMALRDIVLKNHSLKKTIDKIAAVLSTQV